MSTPVEILCKHFPTEFATYLNYCRALRFDDKPDYAYLRRLFRDLFFRQGYAADYRFDWTVLNYQGRKKKKDKSRREKERRSRRTADRTRGKERRKERTSTRQPSGRDKSGRDQSGRYYRSK